MAAGKTGVGAASILKKVEILEEEEDEEEEEEKEKGGEMKGGVTLHVYLDTLMPIGGIEWLKNGVDKLEDEDEFEAAAVYDGAMRLAAVLKPEAFLAR